ncbi:MAG: PAS domain-containing protein [Deltaproteobacteria bacterium]|nr:PAS domain-containing protein [Deltaproteobacteria bacterium]
MNSDPKRLSYWRNLAEASRSFAEVALNYDQAVEAVARELANRVGDYCIVRLNSDDDQQLDVVSCAHFDGSRNNELFKIAESLHSEGNHGLENYLVVPLAAVGSEIGELLLGREAGGTRYSDDDVLLARGLAERATILIRDARRYQKQRFGRMVLDEALDSAPFGFVVVDLDCRYIKVNRALTRPSGRDPALYPGKKVREMVPPQMADAVEEVVDLVIKTGKPLLGYELVFGPFHQIFNSYPVRTPDGTLMGVTSFVLDVTDKSRTPGGAFPI